MTIVVLSLPVNRPGAEGTSWNLALTAIAAAGQLASAAFAAWAVLQSRAEAQATVKRTHMAVLPILRPEMSWTPSTVTAVIRNLGQGAAIDVRFSINFDDALNQPVWDFEGTRVTRIAVEGEHTVRWNWLAVDLNHRRGRLAVAFRDVYGGRYIDSWPFELKLVQTHPMLPLALSPVVLMNGFEFDGPEMT